jgi:hypothetical protein
MTKDEYVERIEAAWRELEEAVGGLDAEGLRRGVPGGWRVQDHLTHLAAWEASLLALLEGEDRVAAMGLAGMDDAGIDEINAALYERHRDGSPVEALAELRESHRRLLRKLHEMSDEAFSRPYSDFQPWAAGEDRHLPVSGWIAGNTWEHYEEHLGYIRPALP